MTSAERTTLDLLFEFTKEWRAEDLRWKELHGAEHSNKEVRVGDRLDRIEDRFVAQDTLNADSERRGLSTRAKVGLGLAAFTGVCSLLIQVTGIALRAFGL